MRARDASRPWPLSWLFGVTLACSSSSDPDASTVPSGGEVPRTLPTLRELPLPALAPDAIGSEQAWLAVAPDGRVVFVATPSPDDTNLLHIVDSTGATIARLGPRGAGPGELTQPWFFDFADGGDLVAWDMSTGRVTTYAPDGTFLASRQIGLVQMPRALVGDSFDVTDGADPRAPYVRQPLGGGRTRDLVRTTTAVFDSVFPVRTAGGVQSRGMIAYAAHQGRIAFGHILSYRILLFDDQGWYLGSVGRSLPPQFPSAEQITAESLSLLKQPSVSPASLGWRLREARTRPIVFFRARALHFDSRGRLWVIRQQDGSAVADVYADTTLLGSIPIVCLGFQADAADIRDAWLAMACRTDDATSPSGATLRLFRIEG